jgi:hypothetical protein
VKLLAQKDTVREDMLRQIDVDARRRFITIKFCWISRLKATRMH